MEAETLSTSQVTRENGDSMRPRRYRIVRSHKETHDTFTMELEAVDGPANGTFNPGQFNMLYAFGAGESAISISGDPAQEERLMHTTRVVGTVTRALGTLAQGDVLGVRGPFGSAWPVSENAGKDIVFVAGGIGMAPLRPAVLQVLANRTKFGGVTLLYGSRTPGDILYRRELKRWRGRLNDVHVTVDRADEKWSGDVGVVTTLFNRIIFDPENVVACVCGPEIMMRFVVMELQRRGVSDSSIYISMERNMKCAIGFCGHCQFGPTFICKDGPVFRLDKIRAWFNQKEI